MPIAGGHGAKRAFAPPLVAGDCGGRGEERRRMSALMRITDSSRTLRHVRKVPTPDLCSAAKPSLFIGFSPTMLYIRPCINLLRHCFGPNEEEANRIGSRGSCPSGWNLTLGARV